MARRTLPSCLVALTLLLTGCGGSSEPNETDRAVSRMMTDCVSDTMNGVARVDAVDNATDAELNVALRQTLAGCASDRLPALAPVWRCHDGGCYDPDGMGYAWDAKVRTWGCARLSADYC